MQKMRTDIILTVGSGLQPLNEHNSRKADTCSDELTCCNASHGIATMDCNNAKQAHISQGVRTNNSYLRFYLCCSVDILNTIRKLAKLF